MNDAITPDNRGEIPLRDNVESDDNPIITPYSLNPQNPEKTYRINNTTAFPPKSFIRFIFGNKEKSKVGLSPDSRSAFFRSESRVIVFPLPENVNPKESKGEIAPHHEWQGHAVAVAMGNRYIAMITSEDELLVEGYCKGNRKVRWAPQVVDTAKGSLPCLAICETAEVIMAAAAITVPSQTDYESVNSQRTSNQQQFQGRRDRGAILIYRSPSSPSNSKPAQQLRPARIREFLDVAPDFLSFDSSGQLLVCITKISTVHTVRIWSIAEEEIRPLCSEQRNVGDEAGVSGLTSSLLFSLPPSNTLCTAPRTYALTTSGRSSMKHYPDESTFLLRVPENAPQNRQSNQGQNSGSTHPAPGPRDNPARQTRNFQVPTHIAVSSAAIPPQVNVVAFLRKGGPDAKVYLIPLEELDGSLVGGKADKIRKFKTGLGGEVAMGFTSNGDKLLVVNHEGLVWQLGFIVKE